MTIEPHWLRVAPAGYGHSGSALSDHKQPGGGRRAFKVVYAG